MLLSIGGGIGAGVAVALGAFTVVASVEAGQSPQRAALLLVLGSVSAIGMQHNPRAPAAASGVTQTGFFVGSALGPPLFGAVADQHSFAVAWLASALLVVLAAALIEVGRRSIAGSATEACRRLDASRDETRPAGAEAPGHVPR